MALAAAQPHYHRRSAGQLHQSHRCGAGGERAVGEVLRDVADSEVSPEEGGKVYRDKLDKLRIKPARSLEDDMVLFTPGLES